MNVKKVKEETLKENTQTTEEKIQGTGETLKDEATIAEQTTNGKKASKEQVEMVTEISEMSDRTKHLLEVFSNCEKLYIDKQGSVYTEGTCESIRKNAILYKNPYFKH